MELWPKSVLESHQTSEEAKCRALEIARALFKSGVQLPPEHYVANISYLALILDGRINIFPKEYSLSDEIRVDLVDTIGSIIASSPLDTRQLLQSARQRAVLGHTISALLEYAAPEREQYNIDRKLRIQALTVLIAIIESLPRGATFATFLPGISSAAARVILGDFKQGQMVFVLAIRLWTTLIHRVLGSQNEEHLSTQETDVKEQLSDQEKQLFVEQNAEWRDSTAENLKKHLEQFSKVATRHESWKVRLEFVKMCRIIINGCSSSMTYSVPLLIELLVALSCDDYNEVSSKAQQVLRESSKEIVPNQTEPMNSTSKLLQLCSENLLGLLLALPRIIRGESDEDILRSLHLVVGYMNVLAGKLRYITSTSRNLKRFSTLLIQLMEFSVRDVTVIAERTEFSYVNKMDKFASPFRKSYKYFNDPRISRLASSICRLLGFHGSLHGIIDHFTDIVRGSNSSQIAAVWCIGEVILGCKDLDESSLRQSVNLIENTARLLTDEAYWHLPTHNVKQFNFSTKKNNSLLMLGDLNQGSIVHKYCTNAILQCHIVECIGIMAQALGTYFDPILMYTLYPLLEKVGSDTLVVSHTALVTVNAIASCLEYRGASELICHNADHLLNTISLNLRYMELNPDAPTVLISMLRCCDCSIMEYLQDTVEEVFEELDGYDDNRIESFIRILLALVSAFARWDQDKECDIKKDGDADSNGVYGSDDDDDDDDGNKFGPVKSVVFNKYDVTVQVLSRCTHFAGSTDPRVRILILDIIGISVHVLHGEDNRLFPAINDFWPVLLARFTDSEIPVRLRALYVFEQVIETASDFMRSRTYSDALPILQLMLRKESSFSTVSPSASKLRFSNGYKLEFAALSSLCSIVDHLELTEDVAAGVAQACTPYLHNLIPLGLQDKAVTVIEHLMTLDPDAIWYLLMCTYAVPLAPTPTKAFKTPDFPAPTDGYQESVTKLLALL